jgi:NAD(P)-dependent dehydrogenase (short-subunit alcohol dehydrogenase family)
MTPFVGALQCEWAFAISVSGDRPAWTQDARCFLAPAALDLSQRILTPGPLEVLPLDAIRREFEVNVFGALAVVNSFLPALRRARGELSKSVR